MLWVRQKRCPRSWRKGGRPFISPTSAKSTHFQSSSTFFGELSVRLRRNGVSPVIVLDEAWLMLAHPAFRDKIREWLKTMRKANCAVVMATQSLSDAGRSGILDVIAESTPTKIFLPNVYARDEVFAELYVRLGLNKRQIELIAEAAPARDYYVTGEKRAPDLLAGPRAP